MGAHLFVVACTGIWIVFGWALASRPVVLVSGLAVWESNRGTPRARRIAVALVALAFIVFWSSVTFEGGGSS
jgi:hypothetical protein